ncbi:MAG: porin family protein [Candidatus Saccharicenans sp.]|uniref:porin family protein n=1 Tax=Candidatus Saccharicenans sp. TaxID=2819258 RepID=UPI00404A4DFE
MCQRENIFFILMTVFALILLSVPGQGANLNIRPGFKLGGGLSDNFGADTFGQSWQPSFMAGVFVDLAFASRLGAALELNFVRRGSLYRLESGGLEYRERYMLDYLEVPLLVKFYLLQGRNPELYIYGGPAMALNLRARLKVTFDDLEESVEVDNLQGTDLQAQAGAGATLALGPGSLLLEFRYSHGLKTIATEPEAEVRNKSLAILAGFRF